MKYLFFPNNQTYILENHSESELSMSLAGYFYDRIEDVNGRLAGIRFHFLEKVSYRSVWKDFISDKRFYFNASEDSVDIVFVEANMKLLKLDRLKINVTQDFGGGTVVRDKNGVLGICFDLSA
jgi:hypothetical protein